MPPPRFTIVVPVHNEAAFIPTAVPRLLTTLAGFDARLVLVENGSRDGTAAAARLAAAGATPPVEVLELPAADYGAALRAGMRRADGEWAVAFDIDYFSREFLKAVLDIGERADVILASKRDPAAHDSRSLLRRLGTRVFNLLLRLFFHSHVTDTHGMKAIRAGVIRELEPRTQSNQDLFDTELVLRAERAGYRIHEVPATVVELREARSSFLRRVPRTLMGLLQLWWRLR